MSNSLRDLPFIANLEAQLKGAQVLVDLIKSAAGKTFPDSKNALAAIEDALSKHRQIQDLLETADKFNNYFAERGWIVNSSIATDVIKEAVLTLDASGMEVAEQILVSYYTVDNVEMWMNRLWGTNAFRVRWELLESALDDYRYSRLYGCIPQLLMVLDGAVSDLNGNRGFFTDTEDLIADDSFVGHLGGLNMLKRSFGGNRNKTTTDPISMPFRNGILHGRDLGYANPTVAAKLWAAMFAVGEWARDLEKKRNTKPETPKTLSESFAYLTEVRSEQTRLDNFLQSWVPVDTELNVEVDFDDANFQNQFLPNSPEYFVGEFMYLWKNRKYGLLVDKVWYPTYKKRSVMIGDIRRMYESKHPIRVTLRRFLDEAPSIVEVYCQVDYTLGEELKSKLVGFRLVYQDKEGVNTCRIEEVGKWLAFKGLYEIGND
jgi:hypothetical protein